jgi:hypothetical protein
MRFTLVHRCVIRRLAPLIASIEAVLFPRLALVETGFQLLLLLLVTISLLAEHLDLKVPYAFIAFSVFTSIVFDDLSQLLYRITHAFREL